MSSASLFFAARRNSATSRTRSAVALVAVASFMALGLSIVDADPAAAVSTATVKATTQRMTEPTLTSTQAGSYGVNTVVSLVCHLRGQAVKGFYSPWLPNGGWDDLWYMVDDGYFVADVDIDTGSNSPVVAQCPLSFDSAPTPGITGTARVGATVAVSAGSWSPAPNLSFQWKINGSAVSGATGSSWTIPAGAIGAAVTVTTTGSRVGYSTTQRTSSAVTVAAGTLSPVKPVLTGSPTVGATLSAQPGTWAPAPVTLSYAWLRDGVAITGQTGPSYVLRAADAAKRVSVRVTGSKTAYSSLSSTSTSVLIGNALGPTPVPVVSGSPRVNSTLSVTYGIWGPAPVTLSVQWLRNGSAISGATTKSYVLTPSDAGASITARVTAVKSGYTTAVRTSIAIVVEKPLTAKTPTISGSAAVGATLTASPGAWAPAPVTLTYRWLRDGTAISGATAQSYLLTSADLGKRVSVKVTGSKPGYTTASSTSASVVVALRLTATPIPAISGTAQQGQSVRAATGTWLPTPVTLSYQWYRAGVPISGAQSATYLLTATDVGKTITVRVTGSKSGYASVSKTSASIVPVALAIVPVTPTISGTPAAGGVLTAVPGAWSPAPLTFTYQWNVNGSPISGATGSTWSVPVWAATHSITVSVTGARTGYTAVTRTSAAVGISALVGSQVHKGDSMPVNSFLRSPNGTYTFVVQSDGNLVVYRAGTPTWASNTSGQSIREFAIQGDGNLVAYNTSGAPFWASATDGRSISALVMQDDGNLVLYDTSGAAIWSTSGGGGGGGGVNGWAYPILPHASLTTYSGHNGDDFPVGVGTPVYSMGAGVVSYNTYPIGSWCPIASAVGGQQTDLRVSTNRDGHTYLITYAHLNSYAVSSGQTVQAGQLIGYSGSKGCASGPHLHIDIKVDGQANVLYPRNIFGTNY